MKPIVILGGGLAGLSTAWHLQEAGYNNYQILEKESRFGGLVRSEVVDGFTFDFTGHVLHFRDKYVKDLVLKLLDGNLNYVERNSWIFSNNVYTRYPFQTNTFGLPKEIVKECILGFVEAKYGKQERIHPETNTRSSNDHPGEQSFEEWIYDNFGAGIAKHFMIPYNDKRWTVHPREMTCKWMGRFVPHASLDDILEGALSDHTPTIGYNEHFYYPLKGGIESLSKAFASSVRNIHVGCEARQIDLKAKTITLSRGKEIFYDKLVSSIPLPMLARIIKPLPRDLEKLIRDLRYNSVFNINIGVDREVTDKHWIYFPEPEYIFHRVGVPSNFSPLNAPPGKSSLYIEISYTDNRPLDKRKVVNRARDDLIKANILRTNDNISVEKCFDIGCAYVIYDNNHEHTVSRIQSFLEANDIYSIVRYGAWEYSGMQDAILHGKNVVHNMLSEERNNYIREKSHKAPLISIVIPIYNEENILQSAVSQMIDEAEKLQLPYELLLCENGSTDKTAEIAKSLATMYPQVRVVEYPEPNYGKALQLGILKSIGQLVVCFEIDFWDAAFIDISQVMLRTYDAVVCSKRAPGARDRRPLIRRVITGAYNIILKIFFRFRGTDTHGMKSFRRDRVVEIVQQCETGKDILATEMVLRMERAGLFMCEIPVEIDERRPPSINLLRRVPSTIRNLIKLWRVTRGLGVPRAQIVEGEGLTGSSTDDVNETVLAGSTGSRGSRNG